jgi:hypothetical protein
LLGKKLKILEEAFGDYRRTATKGGEEFLFHCPKCKHHKKKLSFNIDKDCFKCWICLWSGKSIFRALKNYGNSKQILLWSELSGNIDFSSLAEEKLAEEENISIPAEYISLATHKPNPMAAQASIYLKKRGITFDDVVRWKIGACIEGKYKGRIIIPSFGMDGKCNYFIARTYDKHPITYLNPPSVKDILFNELYIDWKKDVTITEGVFDAIVAGNSIPILGSSLREESHIFQKIALNTNKIYIALDPDAEKKENSIIKKFLSYGVSVFKIEVKPYKDIGCMTKGIFQDRKDNAIEISTANQIEMALM